VSFIDGMSLVRTKALRMLRIAARLAAVLAVVTVWLWLLSAENAAVDKPGLLLRDHLARTGVLKRPPAAEAGWE
jgi:hypothetical protein